MHPHDATSSPNRAVLFVGGAPRHLERRAPVQLGPGDVVVAVDSGLHHALDLRVPIHHVVGDMDSVGPRQLAEAEIAGATIHLHPPDKDATDLELAIALAIGLLGDASVSGSDRPPRLHVVGDGGGRLDHLVADLLMLSAPWLAHLDVTAVFGPAVVTVVRPHRAGVLDGGLHDQVSLLPMHGDAEGVTTTGLRWPLVDAHLSAGTSRAVSNEMVAQSATVEVTAGVLVVIQPGTRRDHVPPRSGPYDPSPRAAKPSSERPGADPSTGPDPDTATNTHTEELP